MSICVRRLAVWGILVIMGLTGCAKIPTSGPIEIYTAPTVESDVPVEAAPEPPVPGSSPRLVVEGFLQSMATYQEGYPVARQYLAAGVRDSWRPENGVTVYNDGYGVTSTPESALLDAPLRGRVGSDGAFHYSSERIVQNFGMVRDADGEWRIGSPPNGILVSSYQFEKLYQPVSVYFFDPGWSTVVPDTILVPAGKDTATTLVQALLKGPTDWLAPAVVTAVPAQTRLNVQSVFVDQLGIAEISLSDAVGSLAPQQRSRLAAQMVWTLGQLTAVAGVRLFMNGAPYAIPENDQGIVRLGDYAALDPNPPRRNQALFGATDKGIVTLPDADEKTEQQPVAGPLGSFEGIEAMGVSAAADQVALVTEGGTNLLLGSMTDMPRTPVLTGSGILRPQFLRGGFAELWTVLDRPGQPGEQVAQRVIGGRVETITLPAFEGTRVVAFRMAPDGVRMAAVRRTAAGRTELGIARVNRANPEPVVEGWRSLSVLETSQESAGEIVDVGWLEPDTLIVLASTGERQPVKPLRLDMYAIAVTTIGQPDGWQAFALESSPRELGGRALVVGRQGAWRYENPYRWPLAARELRAAAYAG